MHRRTLLKTGGLALAGLGIGACGSRSSIRTTPGRRAAVNLAPVRIAWDRVIRTTVGLRPHRPSGFVLRAEKLDDKILIHNYGHGGAGMSLAWGTGAMAADMALADLSIQRGTGPSTALGTGRRAAVLGCGSPGLTAARQLQRRGFDVTIYAMAVPPDTTSNMSSAGFTPLAGLLSGNHRTPAWDAQFRQAAEISYRQLQLLVSPRYGVYWIDNYNATDDPSPPPPAPDATDVSDLLPDHLRTDRERDILQPGEHPFPTKYAIRTKTLAIEPSIYLDALVRDFLEFGGKIVIRKFDTPRDLMSLAEPIIVNSTGLGSKALFGDEELMPVKGQLSVLVPQPEVNYRATARTPVGGPQPAPNIGINPRNDGIAVGNLMDRGNWSLEVDEAVRRRNVDAAIQFFGRMQPLHAGLPVTRSEPPGVPPSMESFFDAES